MPKCSQQEHLEHWHKNRRTLVSVTIMIFQLSFVIVL
jgi:hypothetical protein